MCLYLGMVSTHKTLYTGMVPTHKTLNADILLMYEMLYTGIISKTNNYGKSSILKNQCYL